MMSGHNEDQCKKKTRPPVPQMGEGRQTTKNMLWKEKMRENDQEKATSGWENKQEEEPIEPQKDESYVQCRCRWMAEHEVSIS